MGYTFEIWIRNSIGENIAFWHGGHWVGAIWNLIKAKRKGHKYIEFIWRP